MRAFRSRRRKTHLALLGRIAILVIGSAVSLKLDVSYADGILNQPVWYDSPLANGDGMPLVTNNAGEHGHFDLTVDWDACTFQQDNSAEDCREHDAKVTGRANMHEVACAVTGFTQTPQTVLCQTCHSHASYSRCRLHCAVLTSQEQQSGSLPHSAQVCRLCPVVTGKCDQASARPFLTD